MEKNKDNTDAIEQFLSWLDDYDFKSSFDVYSDRMEKSARRDKTKPYTFTGCWHYTMTKKQKFRFLFVDYKPTPNELNRIMTHPNFSGFDKINSMKICTRCGVIRVQNKETE